ncbi:MAG: hypothetical protein ABIJ18_04880 [archaeon]
MENIPFIVILNDGVYKLGYLDTSDAKDPFKPIEGSSYKAGELIPYGGCSPIEERGGQFGLSKGIERLFNEAVKRCVLSGASHFSLESFEYIINERYYLGLYAFPTAEPDVRIVAHFQRYMKREEEQTQLPLGLSKRF